MKPGQPTIVFDWNCTLLDDIELVLEATNALLTHGGKPTIDLQTYQMRITLPLQDFYQAVGFSWAELEDGFAAIQDVFHDYYEARVHTQRLRPGAAELLTASEAAGVHCLILSNHLEEPIRTQLERLNIRHHFADVLAYADRASQFKHESKGQRLQRYMAEHGLRGADCVIIGDTAEEQHIAQALNMTGVALTGGFFTPERLAAAQPQHLVHGLDEFHGLLRQRGWLT